jgi:hypothetical protein
MVLRSLLRPHRKMYANTLTSTTRVQQHQRSTCCPVALALHQLRPCAATTRHPTAAALCQSCRAPRVLVSRLQRLYINYAARPGASARRAARHAARRTARRRLLRLHRASGCFGMSRGTSRGLSRRSSSTTSPPPRVRVPRHVARLVTQLAASLVVDYFASATRPGASARRAARHAARRAARRRLLRLAQARRQQLRLAQARRRLLRLRRATGWLGSSRGSSCGSLRRSSSTTSPTPRVRVSRHVARPVTRLIVDYSVRRGFVLRPRWLYFSHAVRGDYLSRGNTGSTSSTPCAATTSSSSRIALTIHLD